MGAVSSWYRRQTRWMLFGIGLVTAVALNIDATHAATTLYRDDEVRTAVVFSAQTTLNAPCFESAEGAAEDIDDSLEQGERIAAEQVACVQEALSGAIELPIGWGDRTDTTAGAWTLRVVGWLAVAGSVTLGAPFWYDLLRRAFTLRKKG